MTTALIASSNDRLEARRAQIAEFRADLRAVRTALRRAR